MKQTLQPFSYHTHTYHRYDYDGRVWEFDGRTSPEEMIKQAQQLGWDTIGISNHLIVNERGIRPQSCFFYNYDTATSVYKQLVDDIRKAAEKHPKIKVLVGFEVDYFRDVKWENWFAKAKDTLGADYYIGSTHVGGEDNGHYVFFNQNVNQKPYTAEFYQQHYDYYCQTQKAIVVSSQFNFLAHFDVGRRYIKDADGRLFDDGFMCQEKKQEVVDEIIRYKMPVEVNTGAFALGLSDPHPSRWILEKLHKGQVPVVISDDAHRPQDLGRDFDKAEQLLASIGRFQRYQMTK